MALLFFDGFETGTSTTAHATKYAETNNYSWGTTPRTGSYHVNLGYDGYLRPKHPTPSGAAIVGVAYRHDSGWGVVFTDALIDIREGATTHMQVYRNTS